MSRFTFAAILSLWFYDSVGLRAADHEPGQFQHHPDVQISLFAQEPDIVDPVSLTFADNGDCYVVEMRDYPYGVGADNKPGGTVRLLRDNDSDGQADEAKLFATGLSFPTSIMAWHGGVLVLAPPEIRFLQDTDGDDHADVNEIVVTGLRRGVTDSNANSLRWGNDNLIHVANGGNGGKVQVVGSQQAPLALGNSDFAFDPDAKTIVKTGRTGGGFGLIFDDFGNSFTTHNLDYLQQRIIPTRYIEQSPEMFSFKGTENISDHRNLCADLSDRPGGHTCQPSRTGGSFFILGRDGHLEFKPLFAAVGQQHFRLRCGLQSGSSRRVTGRWSRVPRRASTRRTNQRVYRLA